MCVFYNVYLFFIYAYIQVYMPIPEKQFAKISCELNKGWLIEYI